MQIRRHDQLQILEDARPGKGLALNQSIQELRLVARAAIGGHFEEGLRLGAFVIALRNLLLELRDVWRSLPAWIQPRTVQPSRTSVKTASSPTPRPQRDQNSRASS